MSVFPDELLSLEADRHVTLLYTYITYTGRWKKVLQSLKIYNIRLNEQKIPVNICLRSVACWYMGDNRVIYSRRSLWFSCLSTLSNLLLERRVFPKSLVLLESLLAAVTCQTHCQSPQTVTQYLKQTFGWQWTESGGAVSWPAPSSELNPLNIWKWGHVKTLVYSGAVNALEVLQQRDGNACREIQVKPGMFWNTTQFVRK